MFVFMGRFILAAVVTFAVIFVMSPVLYSIWFDYLRDFNTGSLRDSGDTFFSNYLIMAFLIPGLIIVWGFVSAIRKRVEEESVGEL